MLEGGGGPTGDKQKLPTYIYCSRMIHMETNWRDCAILSFPGKKYPGQNEGKWDIFLPGLGMVRVVVACGGLVCSI